MPPIQIGDRLIGSGHPVYIVAELSANHKQDFDAAAELILAAHEAGADAVKLQTYTPDTLTLNCDNEFFRIQGTPWQGRNLYQLYGEAYTPWEWHPRLADLARSLNLALFSTPFDFTAVDFLEQLGVPAYKVASFEIVDIALLKKIASTRKPIILSTGMATREEIREAVDTIVSAGESRIVLLKCTSAYPAPPEAMNLRTISDLAHNFGLPCGLSDHTLTTTVPIVATALGACVIEKHLTLSRAAGGPDSAFSLEPEEFKAMVKAVRVAEQSLGSVSYGGSAEEQGSIAFRRSLFVVKDIAAGELFSLENIRSIRPGHGLHPRYLDEILGKRARTNVPRGTPLHWEVIEQ